MSATDSGLHRLGAGAIASLVRAGTLSAVSVTEAVLAQIEQRNPQLNCYRLVLPDRAREAALRVDAAIRRGEDPGRLAGVPFGVKDLFDVAAHPTLAGSKINADLAPATQDGLLVRRLSAEGAVLLGTQTMDEYAYGFTTENAHHGATRNPHDPAHSAGGSSGGSAAAVAAGLGALSLGSDTNGSIRVPASFCGIFGLKPTFGRLPRTGSFPFVYDLDHLGPFARSALDLALAYDCLQGGDPADPACVQRPIEPVFPNLQADPNLQVGPSEPAAIRAAVLEGWFEEMAEPSAREAVRVIAETLGARRRVSLPATPEARAAAFVLTASQASNLHRRSLAERPGDFDPATRDRLLAGALVPAQWVLQAQRFRRWFAGQAAAIFAHCDLLIAPATPDHAPTLGQATMQLGGRTVPTRANIGVLTQPISFIGLPVVTVPLHRPGALPIGVQLIAAPWREDLALQAAAWLERQGVVGAPVV